jgi:hypothetical protein
MTQGLEPSFKPHAVDPRREHQTTLHAVKSVSTGNDKLHQTTLFNIVEDQGLRFQAED